MAFTYGFYNSKNHDRRYNALQMSSIFDGIIKDGIFMSIGDCFKVTADGSSMRVTVGTGRAWFNHTWSLNDALMPLDISESELLLDRYDAVVLEINGSQTVRANTIRIMKGIPSSKPAYPEMINTKDVHTYPLAYIYVAKGATTIRQADITSMVGKDSAPYVTGILETVNIENMVAQWEDQWKRFFEMNEEQWLEWYDQYVTEMDQSAERWKNLWHEWYHMYTNSSAAEFTNWKNQQQGDFLDWWQGIRDILTDKVEAMMAEEIENLKLRVDKLGQFQTDILKDRSVYDGIETAWYHLENGQWHIDVSDLQDSKGNYIQGTIRVGTNPNISDYPIEFKSDDRFDPDRLDPIPLVKSGSTLRTLLNQFSKLVKNVRYLQKKLIDPNELKWKELGRIEGNSSLNGLGKLDTAREFMFSWRLDSRFPWSYVTTVLTQNTIASSYWYSNEYYECMKIRVDPDWTVRPDSTWVVGAYGTTKLNIDTSVIYVYYR